MGFTFKGIHSSSKGVVTAIANNPILPAAKAITYSPQHIDGTIDYSDMEGRYFYEDKIIEIFIRIKAKSFSHLNRKCSELAMWLQGKGDLILDDYPKMTYKARVQQTVDFAPQILGHYAELSVQFRVEPFALSGENTYTFELTAGQPEKATIANNGYYTPPTITIDGGGEGKFICNDFEYTGALDGITIYNDIQEVYRGNVCVTGDSNLAFFEIPPGHSPINVSSTVAVNVKIKFLQRFLS